MGSEKNKRGRPTDYNPDKNKEVEMFCKLGATDEEIADFLDIAVSTLNLWKSKHPDFMESIKRGKILADARVAEALYNRAIGVKLPETKVFNTDNGIETYEVTKCYPPDTGAAALWLKNRRSANWKDKQEVDHTVKTTFKVKSKSK